MHVAWMPPVAACVMKSTLGMRAVPIGSPLVSLEALPGCWEKQGVAVGRRGRERCAGVGLELASQGEEQRPGENLLRDTNSLEGTKRERGGGPGLSRGCGVQQEEQKGFGWSRSPCPLGERWGTSATMCPWNRCHCT